MAYISDTYARHRFPAASLSAFMPNPAAGFPSVFHNQLINIIMLKTIKLYETPDMKVFEMHAEGVMCGSIDGVTIQDLEYDEDEDVLGC